VTRLTRYLILLASVALAMTVYVPSAMAENDTTGPDSKACKEATEHAEKVLYRIVEEIKKHKPERPDMNDTRVVVDKEWDKDWQDWNKKEWSEEKVLWILQYVVDHPKWFPEDIVKKAEALKTALHKAREHRWNACKAPEHEAPPAEDNQDAPAEQSNEDAPADNADFSQVNDVPVGPVDTGGGPA